MSIERQNTESSAEKSDIVARLRNTPNWIAETFGNWKDHMNRYDRAPFEAADEIERLRAEVADLSLYEALVLEKCGELETIEEYRNALSTMPIITAAKERAYEAIESERHYQDRKWGAVTEHTHEVAGWLTLMDVHLHRAKEAWASADGDRGALTALRKVLAIGVACAEQHGIPNRSPFQPVGDRMRG